MSKKKVVVFRVLCIFISASLAICISEAAYRCYKYRQLCKQILFSDPSNTNDIFDKYIGYRHRPNETTEDHPHGPGLGPRRWRTNCHGHIADTDYPVQKPAAEFRIAVIGDSFTAGVTNTVRWTSVLEDRLNQNQAWRARRQKSTRVLNLGLEGIGVVQFQDVFEHEALRFEPDVVIVNLIIDDLRRRRYWRGKPVDPQEAEELQEYLKKEMLDPLPWYGSHLEILSIASATRHLGFRSRLDARHYDSADEAMAASLESLRHIVRKHPRVLILHHPMYEDYGRGLDSFRERLADRLYADGADLGVIRMKDMLPDPAKLGIDPVTRWYQRPSDTHPSDEGMVLYGQAVEKALLQRLAEN